MNKNGPLTHNTWAGVITESNYKEIAERILKMLTGKFYTFVTINYDMPGDHPGVRTSQWLRKLDDGSRMEVFNESECYGFKVRDEWNWSVSWSDTWTDIEAKRPHISFRSDRDSERCIIRLQNSYGERLCWVIAVEEHEGGME